jgi:hypothetical protein
MGILFGAELARLRARATVGAYVHVLAASNVRATLRLKHDGLRTGERR